MAAPAAVLAAKAAILAATDKRTWTAAASVVAAVLSPVILIIVMILCMMSGTSSHNNAAVDLSFHGGYLSSQLPADYRMYIEKMRESFADLDAALADINAMSEDGSVDDYRVKAIFYALFFGAEQPRMGEDDYRAFADCFVTYEEWEDEDGATYTVAIPIQVADQVTGDGGWQIAPGIRHHEHAVCGQIIFHFNQKRGDAVAAGIQLGLLGKRHKGKQCGIAVIPRYAERVPPRSNAG